MAAEYEVRIYNPAGALQYILTPRKGLLGLAYTKRVNGVGRCNVVVEGDNEIVSALDLDWQVKVLRKDDVNGVAWYADFDGLFRGDALETDANNLTRYTATFLDANDILARAIVAWKAGVNNRTQFNGVAAETIAKTLVQYNATADATTANGRITSNADIGAFVTIETDGAAGNTLIYTCPYKSLLTTLQEIADIGGGDFNMVKIGARAWQFRWYDGQLGTDRTPSVGDYRYSGVVFAADLDNMANPRLVRSRNDERTRAIVAGQDLGTARADSVVSGSTYAATVNHIEVFVDARDLGTAYLSNRGAVMLGQLRMRPELTFDVLQVSNTLYGKHYFLGDLVMAIYGGVIATKKVIAVTITYDVGQGKPEKIQVEMADL